MTDYKVGDFYVLLIGADVNPDNGCTYGTLIITSPRVHDGIWVCTIWNSKFIYWIKVK